jgi:hypothetical protein
MLYDQAASGRLLGHVACKRVLAFAPPFKDVLSKLRKRESARRGGRYGFQYCNFGQIALVTGGILGFCRILQAQRGVLSLVALRVLGRASFFPPTLLNSP